MARSTMLIVSLRTWHGPRLWSLERKGVCQLGVLVERVGGCRPGELGFVGWGVGGEA